MLYHNCIKKNLNIISINTGLKSVKQRWIIKTIIYSIPIIYAFIVFFAHVKCFCVRFNSRVFYTYIPTYWPTNR